MSDGQTNATTPKMFISYSWTTPGHCDRIRQYGERLISDGVEVILDQWDLSEGQDKNVFMEQMVTDKTVSHVLIFSDKIYAEKADSRKAGVGTESQIISQEVYNKVDQKKFIPIVCERDENGEPYLPVFLRSRIWIDFSTLEAVNENWDALIRALYGKPIHQKPVLGKPPSYITEDSKTPSLPTIGKFASLKAALENQKPTATACRNDFLDEVFTYADQYRIRQKPNVEHFDEKVLDDLQKLLPLRDQIIDWLLLETSLANEPELEDILEPFLEKLLALKYRPADLTVWAEWWFDAMRIFVYEIFLYLIAALVKQNKYATLHAVFTSNYLLPETEARRDHNFENFRDFWTSSDALNYRNDRLNRNQKRLSMIGDLMKERSSRNDLPFLEIMQADLLALLMTLLSNCRPWYPHTLVYAGRSGTRFPLFVRAIKRKHFTKLQTITGISSADELRTKYHEAAENWRVNKWEMTFWVDVYFDSLLNIDALDTMQ